MRVGWGSLVWLAYDALLDSGELIDSSAANGPLRIRVGRWRVLPGLGDKLLGLEEGDERLIRLTPQEAFGEWDPGAVLAMRESRLVGDAPLEDGTAVRIETRVGLSAVCRVYRIMMEGRVALDFNHPFAGQPLTLFVRVLKVAPALRPRLAAVR
jgi:peptidylprolyl isomerase